MNANVTTSVPSTDCVENTVCPKAHEIQATTEHPNEYGETAKPYIDLPAPVNELRSFRYVRPWFGSSAVLDLGCAAGTYLRHFASGSIGLDVSRPNLRQCEKLGLHVMPADLNRELSFPAESFSGAFCSHVLEHVDAPIILLRECFRILKPGGLLALGLPIETSLINRLRGQKYFYHHPGHLYNFSLENISVLLDKTGFQTLQFYFEPRIIPGRLWLSLMQKLPSSMMYTFALAYWVIARKVDSQSKVSQA